MVYQNGIEAETPLRDPTLGDPLEHFNSQGGDRASASSDGGQSVGTTETTRLQRNPLDGLTNEQLKNDADRIVGLYGLQGHREAFIKGALLANVQNETYGFQRLTELNPDERDFLKFEADFPTKSLPLLQWLQAALCALCAIVQGMDQTIINGAQEFYFSYFRVTNSYQKGLINSAPYVAASLLGCWLNAPLNKWFGRRGTIFISCVIAFVTALWQAASPDWIVFVVGRLVLGIAVGAKSATTPVYAAECAPPVVRGRLTMMWQMFTAFGIMLGYIMSLAFQNMDTWGENTQWRWMMGVTAAPPLIVCCVVFFLPESPRYYLEKNELAKAFKSMRRLRLHDIQATRDIYLAFKHIEADNRFKTHGSGHLLREFRKPRNLRAAQSAWFCMFMQQFCGVNVIAYYSTAIFIEAGFSRSVSLGVSLGCGVANFLGAIPALYTIDKFGRRNLLLFTFPFLALCLFWTGGSFYIPDQTARIASVCCSLYVFMLFYSPGMGPVPFTYSAEAFSLSVRPLGMASATAITWAFNFLINFTWPKMMDSMTPAGGFCFYAAWNTFAWFFTFFLLPETKGYSLEELDQIFERENGAHMKEKWTEMKRWFCRCTGADVAPVEHGTQPAPGATPSMEAIVGNKEGSTEAAV